MASAATPKGTAPHTGIPRIVIIGCGFGGLETAKALAGEAVSVTLIDRTNHHLFQPLLYQVATAGLSAPSIAAPTRHLFRDQANLTTLLGEVMAAAAGEGLLSSAHDLSEGGLSQGLVEACLDGGLGVSLTLPEGEPSVMLFSESPARALVSLSGAGYQRFTALCAEHGVPVARLGEVLDSGEIEVQGLFALDLDELRAEWTAPIPAAMEI